MFATTVLACAFSASSPNGLNFLSPPHWTHSPKENCMGSIKFSFSMIWGGALLSMGALLVGTTLVAGETPTPAQRRTVVSGSPQVLTLNDLVSVGHCDWVAQHHSNAALQSAHGQHLAAAHDYLRAIASKNATSIDDARLVLNSAARACSASPSGPAEGGLQSQALPPRLRQAHQLLVLYQLQLRNQLQSRPPPLSKSRLLRKNRLPRRSPPTKSPRPNPRWG